MKTVRVRMKIQVEVEVDISVDETKKLENSKKLQEAIELQKNYLESEDITYTPNKNHVLATVHVLESEYGLPAEEAN